MKSKILAALAFCAMILSAATAGATNSVCTWVSLGSCNFGTGYAGVEVDTTGTLVFNCTTIGSAVTLEMQGGNSGVNSARYMLNGSNHANYQAYIDSAHVNFFGQSAGHQIIVASPVIGNNTVTYYCDLDSGQTLVAGTYTDSSVNTMMVLSGSTPSGNSSASLVAANSCDVSVTANLGFGAYDPIGTNASTPRNATGTIQVACTSGAPYTLMLDQGTNPATGSTTSVPKRQMASGSYRLPYFLYQNSGYSTVWGDTSGTGVGATGTGSYVDYTVYGQIPAGKTAAAVGSYADTVMVTVSY